jgi:hypothetical protein
MPAKKKPTLKADLAACTKANTLVNTELAALKIQYDTVRANLSTSQLERLRLVAVIEHEIEWLETKAPGLMEVRQERVSQLRKEIQPR